MPAAHAARNMSFFIFVFTFFGTQPDSVFDFTSHDRLHNTQIDPLHHTSFHPFAQAMHPPWVHYPPKHHRLYHTPFGITIPPGKNSSPPFSPLQNASHPRFHWSKSTLPPSPLPTPQKTFFQFFCQARRKRVVFSRSRKSKSKSGGACSLSFPVRPKLSLPPFVPSRPFVTTGQTENVTVAVLSQLSTASVLSYSRCHKRSDRKCQKERSNK